MSVTTAIMLSLLAGAPAVDALKQGTGAADLTHARELIKQMGDARFKVRDAAEKELLHLGPSAIEALKEGETDADPHVQERCRALQPTVRALMLQEQIEHFKKNELAPEGLPFAENFLKITGDTKEARNLYAEAVTLHGAMLDDLWRDRTTGMQGFLGYCVQMAARTGINRSNADFDAVQQSIKRADVVVFFLLNQALAGEKDRRFSTYCYQFLGFRVTAETLSSNAAEALPFKKVYLAWLHAETQPYMVQRGLEVAAQAKLPELLPLALKMAKDKTAPIYSRAQVALLLPTFASKEHLKEIEPLLEDKTLIGTFNINNTRGQVQMRDVALAVCIKLSGQKKSDYDFDVMRSNDDFFQTSYIYCAFSSDEKREAAHRKFKEFQAKATKK